LKLTAEAVTFAMLETAVAMMALARNFGDAGPRERDEWLGLYKERLGVCAQRMGPGSESYVAHCSPTLVTLADLLIDLERGGRRGLLDAFRALVERPAPTGAEADASGALRKALLRELTPLALEATADSEEPRETVTVGEGVEVDRDHFVSVVIAMLVIYRFDLSVCGERTADDEEDALFMGVFAANIYMAADVFEAKMRVERGLMLDALRLNEEARAVTVG
jgi:hypothetical protein